MNNSPIESNLQVAHDGSAARRYRKDSSMISNRTTLKAGISLLLVAAIVFVAWPEFRTWLYASSPVLLFLLCPLAMFWCMKGMRHGQGSPKSTAESRSDVDHGEIR